MNQSMSTDIKPGQVWAWTDDTFANGEPGHTFRIDDESHSPGHWNYAYVGDCARFYGPSGHRHVASAEVINHAASLVTDATRAPLDPSNEKADALDIISRGFAALAQAVRDGS